MMEHVISWRSRPRSSPALPRREHETIRSVQKSSGQVLCAAAGSAAVQTASDGFRISTAISRLHRASVMRMRSADRSPGEFYQLRYGDGICKLRRTYLPCSRTYSRRYLKSMALTREASTAAVHAHFVSAMRWRNTAPTSRTCASSLASAGCDRRHWQTVASDRLKAMTVKAIVAPRRIQGYKEGHR